MSSFDRFAFLCGYLDKTAEDGWKSPGFPSGDADPLPGNFMPSNTFPTARSSFRDVPAQGAGTRFGVSRKGLLDSMLPKGRSEQLFNSAMSYRKNAPESLRNTLNSLQRPTMQNFTQTIPAVIRDPSRMPGYMGLYHHGQMGGSYNSGRQPFIELREGAPRETLLHEAYHATTPRITSVQNLSPQARQLMEISRNMYNPASPSEVDDIRAAKEVSSQLGVVKAYMENVGVDTTRPDAVKTVLRNLDRYLYSQDAQGNPRNSSSHLHRLHQYMKQLQKDPAAFENAVQILGNTLPGIVKTDTGSNSGMVA
jgi:hypothetical protein